MHYDLLYVVIDMVVLVELLGRGRGFASVDRCDVQTASTSMC